MMFDPIPGVSRHARERAVERLGRDPPRHEWQAVVLAITDRSAMLVSTQRDRPAPADVYAVMLAGQCTQVLWRPDLGLIVTVVPVAARAIRSPQANNWTQPARNPRHRGNRPQPQPYHRARVMREEWR